MRIGIACLLTILTTTRIAGADPAKTDAHVVQSGTHDTSASNKETTNDSGGSNSVTITTTTSGETTTARDPWVILQQTPGVSSTASVSGDKTFEIDDVKLPDTTADLYADAANDTLAAGVGYMKVLSTRLVTLSAIMAFPLTLIITIHRLRRTHRLDTFHAMRTYLYITLALMLVLWSAIALLRARNLRGENMETLAIYNDATQILDGIHAPAWFSSVITRGLSVAVGHDYSREDVSDTRQESSAPQRVTDWALIIAVATFSIALGKFIDEHVITRAQQSKARDCLIKLFIYLERPRVPQLEKPVLRIVALVKRRLGRAFWPLILLVSYWLFVSAIYVMRSITLGRPDRSYPKYVLLWTTDHPLWLCYALIALVTLAAANLILALSLRLAHRTTSWRVLMWITTGVVASSLIVLDGYTILVVFFPLAYAYGRFVPFAAFALAALPTMLVTVTTFTLVVIRNVLLAIRTIVLHVFDRASDPRTSPLTYLTAAAAVIAVGVKAIAGL